MQLTLDSLCISSKKLCTSCQSKLENHEISQIDIEIGNILLNFAKENKYLNTIKVKNIINSHDTVYIILGQGDKEKIVRAGVKLENLLKGYINKNFNFIETTKNPKKLIKDLISPIIPISTSTIMLPPDWSKELKVQINKREKTDLQISSNNLSIVTEAVLGFYAHYSYV